MAQSSVLSNCMAMACTKPGQGSQCGLAAHAQIAAHSHMSSVNKYAPSYKAAQASPSPGDTANDSAATLSKALAASVGSSGSVRAICVQKLQKRWK